ncbi:MAG: hypothetical protein RSO15_16410 [Bacteroides sp.]|uniref:hypothetical protein n=1 Tax=Bacteroides sp. TaxID=29523 RepID=UPI002FC97991
MEISDLNGLIDRLRNGKKFSIDGKNISQDLKNELADYIENNIDDYSGEEYTDDDDVLYDAIEPVQAADGSWMFGDEENE